MFEEELKDLEQAYRISMKDMEKQVETLLPYLLSYMEQFVTLHKKNEAMREKLDALLAKTGREEGSDE
jgi:methionine salvage enolase-phosphatase E1